MSFMATQEAISLIGFQTKYGTEAACQTHLFQMRYPKGFVCPRCGCPQCYPIESRRLLQCKECGYQASLTVGTVMEKTHLPLQVWFWAIYLVSTDKRGCSAAQISRQLELPYNTAWFLLHRIRKAMVDREESYVLSGIVEFDDSYFGSPTHGEKPCGRGTKRANVLVALSKTEDGKPGYLKMQLVKQAGSKSVEEFVNKHIAKGTVVQTDGLNWYVKPLSEGYVHDSRDLKANEEPDWLKAIHVVISNAKAFIGGTYHGLGTKHLQAYLDEFSYRFNRRFFNQQMFNRLLYATVLAPHITLAELT